MRLRHGDGVRTSLLRRPSEATGHRARGAAAIRERRASQPLAGGCCRTRAGSPWCRNGRVMKDHRFASMGCEIVVGGGSPAEHRAIERLFAEREAVFSRFIPQSELNRVNGSAGRIVLVSQLFADTLRVALNAAEDTQGVVEPTLGAALESAGYTRDSSLLAADPRPPGPARASSPVLALGRLVGLRPGVKLDLNGVVKSLAVDDALAILSGEGFVSAGGDRGTRRDRRRAAGRWIGLIAQGCSRDERYHQANVVARRAGPASPDRRAHRSSGCIPVVPGDGVRSGLRGGGCRG